MSRAVSFVTGYASQPDERIQFVHGTVGFDARRFFRDALPTCQGSLALVAPFGVNAVKGDSWVVKRWFRHTSMLTWGILNPIFRLFPGSSCWLPPLLAVLPTLWPAAGRS